MRKTEIDGARDESLNWLAAGTVHDVNNLLVLVIGCAEMALDDETLSPRTRKLMEDIVGVGERASSLTRQFLAVGRPSGRPTSAVDVAAVVAGAQSMLRRLAGDRIQVWCDPGATSRRVLAESSEIEQILVNLVSNARDAMPSGGTIRLVVGLGDGHPAGLASSGAATPMARIVVTDSGCGIDPAVRDRIFDPFFTTKAGKGSGLGLAVVRATVERLGGRIDVNSSPVQGTSFTIDLPLAD